jgi:hypothetical protein
MTDADFLRGSFVALTVNADFTEAALVLSDQSSLRFCHRVGERTVKAMGTGACERVLAKITLFRLNPKHLDVHFEDGSRWEALLGRGRL